MLNCIHRTIVILLLLTVIIMQGCASYHTDFAKGNLLNESQTDKAVIASREPTIALQSPLSVKVADKVEYYDVYEQKYEKKSISTQYRASIVSSFFVELIMRPISTVLIFPMFGDGYWYYGLSNCAKESENGSMPIYCNKSDKQDIEIVPDEFILEKVNNSYRTKYETKTVGDVLVKVNDNPEIASKINADGTTKISLDTYIDPFGDKKDFNIVYRYENAGKSAKISSLYTYEQAKKDALESLPAYRQRGIVNKSASDFIMAFNISFDPKDLQEATKYASTDTDKTKVAALMGLYNSAIDNVKFAQAQATSNLKSFIENNPNSYHLQEAIDILDEEKFNTAKSENKLKEFIKNSPKSKFIDNAKRIIDEQAFKTAGLKRKLREFVKNNPNSLYIDEANRIIEEENKQKSIASHCKGDVMSTSNYLNNGNIYADVGRCVSITASKMQVVSPNSGLFTMESDIVYIEFPNTLRGVLFNGIVKIKGMFNYTTKLGLENSVPHFQFIADN